MTGAWCGLRHVGLLLAGGAAVVCSAGDGWPMANFSGGSIPLVGFGCGSPFKETYLEAVKLGYRHFDTAFAHKNHWVVGEAIRSSGVPREEIFLTTKVSGILSSLRCCFGLVDLPWPPSDPSVNDPLAGAGTYAKGRELEGLRLALKELGLDYIDLCLIHRPSVTPFEMQALYLPHYHNMGIIQDVRLRYALQELLNAAVRLENMGSGREEIRRKRADAWRQMEEAKRLGICKHIGVSNYPLGALKEMEGYAREMPQVIQMENTPICRFPAILDYAREKNMAVTGYGTGISKGVAFMQIHAMSQRLGRTPNQVVLRWRLQHNVGLLQGSFNPAHMKENLEVLDFELSPADMAELDRLNRDFPLYFDLSWFDSRDGDLLRSFLIVAGALLIGATVGSAGCCLCCCCFRPCRKRASSGAADTAKKDA